MKKTNGSEKTTFTSSPINFTQTGVCPTCGRCPTCGKKDAGLQPNIPYNPSYPGVTWGGNNIAYYSQN